MHRHVVSGLCMLLVSAGLCRAAGPSAPQEWKFGKAGGWGGWSPNGHIADARFEDAGVSFRTAGGDPSILSPLFEVPRATNTQWVEIDLDCQGPGMGQLFYTNKTIGQYGGLEPDWVTSVGVPGVGRQTVQVWPFWEGLGKIIRLRFDPPDGVKCTLYAIRIMESQQAAPPPVWQFGGEDSWQVMHAARLERGSGRLRAHALRPQAMIITPVEPFDASKRSLLRMKGWCSGEQVIGFYWVAKEHPGLMGEPISPGSGELAKRGGVLDLRTFPMWQGTITHLAIAFGTFGKETLELLELSIESNDQSRPALRLKYLGFDKPINRPEQPAVVKAMFEHTGGPAVPAGTASLVMKPPGEARKVDIAHAAIEPGRRVTLKWPAMLPPYQPVELRINGQVFPAHLRIDSLREQWRPQRPINDYAVPPPRPVKTRYNLGIYYFPGWSADQMSRWEKQRDFPEREPVLGWYAEGEPEVADWHIKWAVENGLSFFIYDWYWRNGNEDLAAGLNEGFLKARYNKLMKFAVMWANHKPFANHTPEQLVQVADYWIDNYFRRPNYLEVDGRPYVSFFSPADLIADLGTPENVRKALEAMRDRVKAAGFPGLHIGVCGGTDRPALEVLKQAGFDSVTGYNYIRTGAVTSHSTYRQFLIGHETIWQSTQQANVLPYIPLLGVGWDARPWHGPRTERKFARHTQVFEEGLRHLKANLDATGGKMAILEAWNEWGEGSYIEPNAEFGFGDLEAIRRVFGERGEEPANIGPADVGLEGRYDLRLRTETRPALNPPGIPLPLPVMLVGVNPQVRSGLALTCMGNRIEAAEGRVDTSGLQRSTRQVSFQIEPADLFLVKDLPMKLVDGPVKTWHGGNRLVIRPEDPRNLLPGSYVPGSLKLRDPADAAKTFAAGHDYVVDDTWGAFALAAGGSLKAGQDVLATYWMSKRRIDSLIMDEDGEVRLLRGVPSADCPVPPQLPFNNPVLLANIYRPFKATRVEPMQVYPPRVRPPWLRPEMSPDRSALQPVIRKLKAGEPVTIVCWGDSVTACGEASSSQTCYVGAIEGALKDRFGRKTQLRVINAGIGGSSTPGRLPNFQKEVLDHKPDVVTLEFVNDMGIPVEQLKQLYAEILKRTKDAGAVLVIITPHWTMPEWMGLPRSGLGKDTRPAVAFLRQVAKENHIPLADASARWEQLQYEGVPYETLLRNGINHPDDRGHAFFAQELWELFR